MSKRRSSGPMPSTGAGLMRFYDEDTPGFSISPMIVIGISILLITVVYILKLIELGKFNLPF